MTLNSDYGNFFIYLFFFFHTMSSFMEKRGLRLSQELGFVSNRPILVDIIMVANVPLPPKVF